jgi:hypothetical protein
METLNKTIDTAAKLAAPIGVVIMLWLQSQFVSRGEFEIASEKLSGRVEKIEAVLIRMEANAETDKRHDKLLADHENRIRTLEREGAK